MTIPLFSDPSERRFTDPLYSRIAELIYREAGIVLGPDKVGMMDSRLNRRVRANDCADLAEYVRKLDGGMLAGERDHLVSALTTNFTNFFREGHHFEFLEDGVFREQATMLRTLRIWSAGCSSGQEPYSAAICARLAGRRVEITATDVDHAVLASAEAASYRDTEIAGLSSDLLSFGFEQSGDEWRVRPAIRDVVTFRQMNLHAAWNFDQLFDVIFCRNVIIYFDADAQQRLWEKFCRQLNPGGYLFIGHSERIPDHMRDRLRPVQHTIYQYMTPPDRNPVT